MSTVIDLFAGTKTSVGRQIGNAVPPLLATRLLEAVAVPPTLRRNGPFDPSSAVTTAV